MFTEIIQNCSISNGEEIVCKQSLCERTWLYETCKCCDIIMNVDVWYKLVIRLAQIKCGTAEVDGFKVYVGANEFECNTEGQEIAVHGETSKYTSIGTLICPPYKLVCQVGGLQSYLHFRFKPQEYSYLSSNEILVSLQLWGKSKHDVNLQMSF